MTKTIQELVQEQVRAKIATGEALEAAVNNVNDAAAQLKEAESDAAKARRDALKSGWSESELRSLGLGGGARARRRSSTDDTSAAHAIDTDDGMPSSAAHQ